MGTMGKLRIGGVWSGVLEVDLDNWTVAMLREEVANRSHCNGGPQCINLICAGRVLRDGDGSEKLTQLGVKNNAKILASNQDGKSVKEEFLAEEERSKRISRLKATATTLASRHADGSLPVDDFNLELENQSGEKFQLGSETDQRAIMMGLMLHANAKALIKKELYRDALEVLILGEEAFTLCNPKLIEMVDNVPILQIDMVWCYFMLRDINSLSVADNRLAKAREGIERAHGKESSRLRILQGGCYPELALHLRMELLEGVIAYHSGHLQKCKNALATAQTRYFQLQVPDESLSLLMNMGYKERRAKRALRMNNLDVGRSVDFLVEEEKTRARKREENLLRQQQIIEQKEYGLTPLRKAVDLQKLDELVSIGFQKDLVAEALRRNENNFERALDDLTNPETHVLLQNEVISRKRKRSRRATSENGASASNTQLEQPNPNENNAAHGPDPSIPLPDINELDANEGSNAGGGGGGSSTVKEQRDMEMEEELTGELQKTDAYSDYDIDVTKEGEALHEYLALLNSAPQEA